MSLALAEIFDRFGERFDEHYSSTSHQRSVIRAIRHCRTEAMGWQLYRCTDCGFEQSVYLSCRNRHCPKCQGSVRARWVQARQEEAIDVPYFHLVFTLPHELNRLARFEPQRVYRTLFKSVWHTLDTLAKDRLDGQLGMTAVLHTWGQTLTQHIHLHCLIPAGAFNASRGRWQPSRSKYLFPVKVMQRLYRGHYVSTLRRALSSDNVCLPPDLNVDDLLDQLMAKTWSLYAKPVLGHVGQVIEYLGRYTYRIAIGHERLLQMEADRVAFRYKDYRDHDRHKVMTLDGVEFMRRFLQHVVPRGFMRVRHFGFLANRVRADRLNRIRALLPPRHRDAKVQPIFIWHCPHCKTGSLCLAATVKGIVKEVPVIDSS